MRQIRIYKKTSGEEPFTKWLNSFKDRMTKARIQRRIDRLYCGNEGDFKSVGKGVYELRLTFGAGYRVYYAKEGKFFIILLSGGTKSTQTKDIKLAQQYWQELQEDSRHE